MTTEHFLGVLILACVSSAMVALVITVWRPAFRWQRRRQLRNENKN